MYYVDKFWKLDVENVIKCWPKMSWNVNHKFRQCFQMLDLWSLEVTKCDQMLSKCSKMLEIGCQKCDQMLAQNVLECE